MGLASVERDLDALKRKETKRAGAVWVMGSKQRFVSHRVLHKGTAPAICEQRKLDRMPGPVKITKEPSCV